MADINREQLYNALRNADASGDTAGAQRLAQYIQTLPPENSPAQPTDLGRVGGLGVRAIGEGVASAATALPDAQMGVGAIQPNEPPSRMHQAAIAAQNTMAPMFPLANLGKFVREGTGKSLVQWLQEKLGVGEDHATSIQGTLEEALTAAGAPTPETGGEKLGYAAAKGTAAGVAGGVGMGLGPVRAGLGGLTGGSAQEATRQLGGGEGAQLAANLAGSMIPGAAETVMTGASRIGQGIVRPLTEKGRGQIVSDLLKEHASDPNAAATQLAGAREIVPGSARNTGEASGDVGLMGLEKTARQVNPTPFGERIRDQNFARQVEARQLAGSERDIEAAKEARNDATGPLRDAAMTEATDTLNTVNHVEDRFRSKASALQDKGRFDTTEAQMGQVADNPYLAVSGHARVPGRLAPHADRRAEAQGASGEMGPIIQHRQAELAHAQAKLAGKQAEGGGTPLHVDDITGHIDSVMSTPGLRASTVVENSMGEVRAKLEKLADQNGNLHPEDLYMVRKEMGNYIQKHAQENKNFDSRLSAGLQNRLQDAIDGAFYKATGKKFDTYMSTYREMSKPIDQMQTLQDVVEKGQSTAIDPTTGGEQRFLRSAGFSRALDKALQEHGDELTPLQKRRLESLREDLGRSEALAGPLVKSPGSDTLRNIVAERGLGSSKFLALPFVRSVARFLYGRTDEKINSRLAKALLDPQDAAQLLKQDKYKTLLDVPREARDALLQNAVGGQEAAISQREDDRRRRIAAMLTHQ